MSVINYHFNLLYRVLPEIEVHLVPQVLMEHQESVEIQV